MYIVLDALEALIIAGIPVGIFSFLMVYFAYEKHYLSLDVEIKHAFKEQDVEYSSLSKKHKKKLKFMHSKWVAFGGGYYGLIALITFVVIELTQVVEFLLSVTGWQDFANLLSVSALISMFIDSIVNMVKAAIWFTYWPSRLEPQNFIIWIIVTYITYRYGAHLAKRYVLTKREKCSAAS